MTKWNMIGFVIFTYSSWAILLFILNFPLSESCFFNPVQWTIWWFLISAPVTARIVDGSYCTGQRPGTDVGWLTYIFVLLYNASPPHVFYATFNLSVWEWPGLIKILWGLRVPTHFNSQTCHWGTWRGHWCIFEDKWRPDLGIYQVFAFTMSWSKDMVMFPAIFFPILMVSCGKGPTCHA